MAALNLEGLVLAFVHGFWRPVTMLEVILLADSNAGLHEKSDSRRPPTL